MKVSTKYNLRDKVWFMYQNRPTMAEVRYIYITLDEECRPSIQYLVNNDDTKRDEETLYSTKQELLNTL